MPLTTSAAVINTQDSLHVRQYDTQFSASHPGRYTTVILYSPQILLLRHCQLHSPLAIETLTQSFESLASGVVQSTIIAISRREFGPRNTRLLRGPSTGNGTGIASLSLAGRQASGSRHRSASTTSFRSRQDPVLGLLADSGSS